MQFYVFCSIIPQTITVILYGKLFILQRIFIYFYGGFFMQSPKRNFPTECGVRAMPSGSLAESFPFYIKECGFCSERKFVPGKAAAAGQGDAFVCEEKGSYSTDWPLMTRRKVRFSLAAALRQSTIRSIKISK